MTKLPQVKGDRLVAALRKEGWYVDRTSGSHVIMRHPDRHGIMVVIPVHVRPIKLGTLGNILKKTGVSAEKLKKLL